MSRVAILSISVNEVSGEAIAVSRRVDSEKDIKAENEVEIFLSNVVSHFSVGCELNLLYIAKNGHNVEFNRNELPKRVLMRFKRPDCTASIWAKGTVSLMGATTEADAKTGARRCGRALQKLGIDAKITNYRISNLFATCTLPFGIGLEDFAKAYPKSARYEPEQFPGVVYRMRDVRATLKIYASGIIVIYASSVAKVQKAAKKIYCKLFLFKREREEDELWRRINLSSGRDDGPPAKRPRVEEDFVNDEDDEKNAVLDDCVNEEDGRDEVHMQVDSEEDEFFDCLSSLGDDVFHDCL